MKCKYHDICKLYQNNAFDCNNERESIRCGHFREIQRKIKLHGIKKKEILFKV